MNAEMQHRGYQVEAIPRARATIVDALAVGARRHMVHGFVEVDVTRARAIIRRHEHDTGESLSFTAFVIAAAARAIVDHDVVDGARAARFIRRLRESLEMSDSLELM